MDQNSPKPSETVDGRVSAIRALVAWLDREGTQRIPQVLSMLASQVEEALCDGRELPTMEVESLAQCYFDAHGGSLNGAPAGRWLQRPKVESWWRARANLIRQACMRAGSDWMPKLVAKAGGGRGNSTEYSLEFTRLKEDTSETEPDLSARRVRGGLWIQYNVESVRTAPWIGWISSVPEFHVRSWRGLALLATVGAAAAWIVVATVLIAIGMWSDRPISGRNWVELAIVGSMGWLLWSIFRPICQLPWQRVTLAPDIVLRNTQSHAQFRLTRNNQKRSLGNWFSVVRHWGTCPLCAGEVDLRSGGAAFPERLVGRCADSPLEHVYSFDPVTLSGRLLRTDVPDFLSLRMRGGP